LIPKDSASESVETVLETHACCTYRPFEKYFQSIKVRDTYQNTSEPAWLPAQIAGRWGNTEVRKTIVVTGLYREAKAEHKSRVMAQRTNQPLSCVLFDRHHSPQFQQLAGATTPHHSLVSLIMHMQNIKNTASDKAKGRQHRLL
jgi:hypothetical protein